MKSPLFRLLVLVCCLLLGSRLAAAVPPAFGDQDWSFTSTDSGTLALTAWTLPAPNVTDVQYRIGSGNWISLGWNGAPSTINLPLAPGATHDVQIRAVNADGAGAVSVAKTAATPSGADIVTVTNAQQLYVALIQAPGGRIIECAPGDYGYVGQLTNMNKTPAVTIRPQDRANPPVFTGDAFYFNSCQGIVLDGLRFFSSAKDESGYTIGTAAVFSTTGRITVRRCHFKGYLQQLSVRISSDVLVEWNTFEGSAMDHMRFYEGMNRLIVRNNKSFGINYNPARLNDRHPDHIQFAVNIGQTGAKNVLIERNIFLNEIPNATLQTISFFHETLRDSGSSTLPGTAYYNLTVRDNFIQASHLNAIALWGVIGAQIKGNTLRRTPGTGTATVNQPTLHMYKESLDTTVWLNRGVVANNNVWPADIKGQAGFSAFPMQEPGTGGDLTGNIVSASDTVWPVGWVMPVAGHDALSIISISLDEVQGRNPMSPAHLAGAGGLRGGHWNNAPLNSQGDVLLLGEDLVYQDGSAIGGDFGAAFDLRATWIAPANLADDPQLFAGYSQLRESGHAITLVGIPFAHYEIYVYVDGGHAARGGSVSLGSQTFYVRGNMKPAANGTGYVQATSTTYNSASPSLVATANYVRFEGLTGSGQVLSLAALNMGDAANLRLNVVGIQIVKKSP